MLLIRTLGVAFSSSIAIFADLFLTFRYVDEDGEPLMDPDAHFYREPSAEPAYRLEDDDAEDDWRRERSPTPVHGSAVEKGGKPRKRLVKKSGRESSPVPGGSLSRAFGVEDLDDWEEEPSSSKKRKPSSFSSKEESGGSGKKGKGKLRPQQAPGKPSKSGSKGYEGFRDHGRDSELNEMWNTVAGGDSEVRTSSSCKKMPDVPILIFEAESMLELSRSFILCSDGRNTFFLAAAQSIANLFNEFENINIFIA